MDIYASFFINNREVTKDEKSNFELIKEISKKPTFFAQY